MKQHATEYLVGQKAEILLKDKTTIPVTFGHDVQLRWESGTIVHSKSEPQLHPEIHGTMSGDKDYSGIKGAELILADQRVFRISFVGVRAFSASESIDSRHHVYPED